MSLMRFDLAGNSLQFEAGGQWPAEEANQIMQAVDRTAAGGVQVESLGLKIAKRILVFDLMSLNDYAALKNWFNNVSVASLNVFTFTDEYGYVGDVRIMDDEIRFRETSLNVWAGTLTLEYA